MSAADTVAQVEADATASALAAQEAERAARAAVESAAVLENQIIIDAAATARELAATVETNEDDISWMKRTQTEMQASILTLQSSVEAIAQTLTELKPLTPAPAQSNEDADDLPVQVVEIPPEPPAKPAPAEPLKKHRLI